MLFIICELFLFLQGRSDKTLDIYRNQGKQVRLSHLFVEKALAGAISCSQFVSFQLPGLELHFIEKRSLTSQKLNL